VDRVVEPFETRRRWSFVVFAVVAAAVGAVSAPSEWPTGPGKLVVADRDPRDGRRRSVASPRCPLQGGVWLTGCEGRRAIREEIR